MGYYIEGIDQNELSSKKHKMVCTALSHIQHSLMLAYMVTECISISAFIYVLLASKY